MGTWTPLDQESPKKRINYNMKSTKPNVINTDESNQSGRNCFTMNLAICLILLGALLTTGWALKCYECRNVRAIKDVCEIGDIEKMQSVDCASGKCIYYDVFNS